MAHVFDTFEKALKRAAKAKGSDDGPEDVQEMLESAKSRSLMIERAFAAIETLIHGPGHENWERIALAHRSAKLASEMMGQPCHGDINTVDERIDVSMRVLYEAIKQAKPIEVSIGYVAYALNKANIPMKGPSDA